VRKGSVAARQSGIWLKWFWLLAAATIAISLTLNARAIAGETGSTDEYGGVALNNSVLLDPFDPVPEIHFRDGGCRFEGCERDCFHRDCEERFRCHDNCRWHGWVCEHGCYDINRPRDGAYNVGWWRCADDCRSGDWWCDHDCHLEGWHCEHDCFIHEPGGRYGRRGPFPPMGDACPDVCYGRLIHEYEAELAHHAEEQHRYDEQSRWYFEHVVDRTFLERLFDWHRPGPPPVPPPPPPPPPVHGPDGYGPHGPDAYGPPPGPHGPDGYGPHRDGPHGPPPGGPGYGPPGASGVVYGPGPAGGGYGPPSGPGSYGPPGPPPGHGSYGPPPPPGPGPGSYSGSAPPPPGATPPPPPGAVPTTPPPGAVPTTPPPAGPGPGDFGPPPGPH